MKGIHTMLPGVIESFDSATQLAKINLATAQERTNGDKLSFPPLINVPVQFFRWGGFSITAPVNAGDECAVFFSERSMDRFLKEGGQDKVPFDARFFDLSDAYAVTGLTSSSNAVQNFDTSNLVIKADSGNTVFTLTPDGKFSIANSTGEFVTEVDKLLGVLAAETVVITGGSSVGTYPITGNTSGAYTAIKNVIASFKI
jgi:hypothetical protein